MSCVSEACRNLFFPRKERLGEALSEKLAARQFGHGDVELQADRITGSQDHRQTV